MSHIRHQDGRNKNLEEQLQKAKEDYAAALTAEDDIQQEIFVTQTGEFNKNSYLSHTFNVGRN